MKEADGAPPRLESIHTRTLQRAAELLGDELVLAHLVGMPWPRLKLMLAGIETTPTDVFLAAVDIVNNESKILQAQLMVSRDVPSAMRRAIEVRHLIKS
jgi:hypothetical protein